MNGPKAATKPDWTWAPMPQDGRVQLAIACVARGGKSFLAYAGLGTMPPGAVRASTDTTGLMLSELTHQAVLRMSPLVSGTWLVVEVETARKAPERVRFAMEVADDDGVVLFVSPDDPTCAAVTRALFAGKRMKGLDA